MMFVEDGQGLPMEMVLFPSRTDRVQNGCTLVVNTGGKVEGSSSWFRLQTLPYMIYAFYSISLHPSPATDSRQMICEQ